MQEHMRSILVLTILLNGAEALAQPLIEWQRTYGGSMDDTGASAEQTSDGGYIICGTTYSNNGDVTGNHGNGDIWLVKLDADGEIEWQRALGGSQPDIGKHASQLPGGGYLVVGSSRSNDGDVSGNHGVADIWLAKVDEAGEPIWQRSYGGSLADVPFGIKATPDGGWIIAGDSRSSDGDVTSNAGFTDYWVLKIDTDGDIEWERSYGGSSNDTAYAIALTGDGGYVLNGVSYSSDGDVSGGHGVGDYWVLKLDGSGNIQWQRPCGGSDEDYGFSVLELANGNIVAFGEAGSEDGDVTGQNGASDYWMVELSSAGAIAGNEAYGGSITDRGASIALLSESAFLYSGAASSSDGDVPENSGSFDGWLIRTDASGAILWQLVLGGSQSDGFGGTTVLSGGGFLVRGSSSSSDGDLPGNQGESDIWIVKLGPDPVGIVEQLVRQSICVYPNPCNNVIHVGTTTVLQDIVPWCIVDPAGRLMNEGLCVNGACQIDVRDLAPGEYTLLLEDTGRRQATPFVKQ